MWSSFNFIKSNIIPLFLVPFSSQSREILTNTIKSLIFLLCFLSISITIFCFLVGFSWSWIFTRETLHVRKKMVLKDIKINLVIAKVRVRWEEKRPFTMYFYGNLCVKHEWNRENRKYPWNLFFLELILLVNFEKFYSPNSL